MRRLASLHTLLLAAPLALLALVAGCGAGSTDSTAPAAALAPARVALAASVGPIAQASAGPVTLDVAVSYLRAAGAPVSLGIQHFTLGDAGTQQLPITVDVSTCLADPARSGAALGTGVNGTCELRLDLVLRQGDVVLDRQTIGPVLARPGQTAAVAQPVALYSVATVSIVVGGAPPPATGVPVRLPVGQTLALGTAAADATGKPVASPAPLWSSDAPAIATVDSVSGLVTPRAPGRATITATVGAHAASILVAVVPAPAPITVTVAGGLGTGTVTSQPAGIACQVAGGQSSGACAFTFPGDSAVTLTAVPATGSSFSAWGGDCATAAGSLTCVLTPSAPRAATVTFVAFRTLGVTLAGSGDGTVTSQPAGISCTLAGAPGGSGAAGTTSGSCAAPYLDGTAVTLSAAPSATSTFVGWGGACTGAAACTVTLSQAQSVTATFARRQQSVTLALSGSAGGTVFQSGAAVCALPAGGGSTSCVLTLPVGTAVSFTAQGAAGAQFNGWAGPCAGTGACAFTVTADVMLGATFVPVPVAVSVAAAPQSVGAGTVTSSPAGIACALSNTSTTGPCATTVPSGSQVVLTAAAAAGYRFVVWGGACAAAGVNPSCSLPNVTTAAAATATFGPTAYPIVLAPSGDAYGTGAGTITGPAATAGAAALACVYRPSVSSQPTGVCAAQYAAGTTVMLTATPDQGSVIGAWTGACAATPASSSTCAVPMTQAQNVGVTFSGPFQIGVTLGPGANTGYGTVFGSGVACVMTAGAQSGTCATPYTAGQSVTYNASPDGRSYFSGWSASFGAFCGGVTGFRCTFTATSPGVARPGFELATTFELDAGDPQSSGTTFGTVLVQTAGVPDQTVTASQFNAANPRFGYGNRVTLTAQPATGYHFVGWQGDCSASGANPVCTLAGYRPVRGTGQSSAGLVQAYFQTGP